MGTGVYVCRCVCVSEDVCVYVCMDVFIGVCVWVNGVCLRIYVCVYERGCGCV